jgi:threonylcarbamoyladenosine tRNA methylthiotransferase MtaB
MIRNTLKLINIIDFSYLHVFPYSLRPGTKASSMRYQIPGQIKRDRVKLMREINHLKKISFINKNIGLEHQIVVETVSEDVISGTTSNYIKTLLRPTKALIPGKLVRIRLTGIENENALAFPIIGTEPQDK